MHRFALRKLAAAALIAACAMSVQAAQVQGPGEDDELVPTGKGWGQRASPDHAAGRNAKPTGNNGISYHGGPVMTNGVNAYYIWYGGWTGDDSVTILTDLAQSIGGSPYFNINTTYYDGSNQHVLNSVHYASSAMVGYTHGTALSDSNIQTIVSEAIGAGMTKDPKGVYFVLTSADVNETSGFCTQYCGWHTHGNIGGMDIKYAFIGNPNRCPSACEVQTTGPNGNVGADGMASILSHELEEATTDPDLNAWYDRRGQENADKCAWTGLHNITLPTGTFAVQPLYSNAAHGCVG
jgi:Phosphate-induced protein 1 conserved region